MLPQQNFADFVRGVLAPAIPPDMIDAMISEVPLESYFRRAFTHRTFAINRVLKNVAKFDYEIIEKLGDGVLKAAFQLWIYDFLGEEIQTPELFSNIEKKYTGNEYLAVVSDGIGFPRWIQVAEGTQVTNKMKSDIFESFIAAIVLAGNYHVMDGIGLCLAQRWIFQVYNTYARDSINPKDPSSFADKRSQINDLWQFYGWGTPMYIEKGDGQTSKALGAQPEIEVDLEAPNVDGFPEQYRGGRIGFGRGQNKKEAQERAAANALDIIGAQYPELKAFEVQMETGDVGKFTEILASDQQLLKQVLAVLPKVQRKYQNISIRRVKTYNIYAIQIRVQAEGIWRSAVRTQSKESFDAAIIDAFRILASKADKGELNV